MSGLKETLAKIIRVQSDRINNVAKLKPQENWDIYGRHLNGLYDTLEIWMSCWKSSLRYRYNITTFSL